MVTQELIKKMTENTPITLNIKEIQKLLPHRYPFVMIDRVDNLIPGESAIGYKNITINEPQFTGHFPDQPIMPGVLQVEASAQLACMVMLSKPEYMQGYIGLFTGLEGVKFRKIVVPGDKLVISVQMKKFRFPFGKFDFRGEVDGELTVEGTLSFAMSKEEDLG